MESTATTTIGHHSEVCLCVSPIRGSRTDDLGAVFASIEEALDRPYAYVVVTTKAVPEVQKTSKLLAPLLVKTYPHSQPTYILMQNGMNVEVDLYQALKAPDSSQGPSIISTSVWAIANMLDDCTVQHYNVVSTSVAYPSMNLTLRYPGPHHARHVPRSNRQPEH